MNYHIDHVGYLQWKTLFWKFGQTILLIADVAEGRTNVECYNNTYFNINTYDF